MTVSLLKYPKKEDWDLCKECALTTVWKEIKTEPTLTWKQSILRARHSPIRTLMFMFRIENIPYHISTHLCRHIHATPFVSSQRNDRQDRYDRNTAPQNAPVNMMWWMNAEELMVIANKRLCQQASQETKELVQMMCWLVEEKCPEFKGLLVPMCKYHGDVCHEINSCGRCDKRAEDS